MQVYLRPTRHEALTASDTTLTRRSLDTNPAAIPAKLSGTPRSLFTRMIDPGSRLHAHGGVTVSADGLLVALEHPLSRVNGLEGRLVLEWRQRENLSLARMGTIPQMESELLCLASSPDGGFLVLGLRLGPDAPGLRRP